MTSNFILAIALALPMFFVGYQQDDGKEIEGTWVIEEAELAGQKLDGLKGIKITMDAGKYRFANDQGEYKLVPAEKFKAVDIFGKGGPNQGKTYLTIYQLEGDSLTICYDLTGKARPTEFKTVAGSQLFLVTYRRENTKTQ